MPFYKNRVVTLQIFCCKTHLDFYLFFFKNIEKQQITRHFYKSCFMFKCDLFNAERVRTSITCASYLYIRGKPGPILKAAGKSCKY